MSVRTEKVGALIRESVGVIFQRYTPDYLDGMVTVVSVKMSPDLRVANVYVSIYRSKTSPDILIKRLNTHVPEIRHQLTELVDMRFVPELRFFRDDTLDTAERIDSLLKKVRKEDEEREAERIRNGTNGEQNDDQASELGEQ